MITELDDFKKVAISIDDKDKKCDGKEVFRVTILEYKDKFNFNHIDYYILKGKIVFINTSGLDDFKQGKFSFIVNKNNYSCLPTFGGINKTLIPTDSTICHTWTEKSVEMIKQIRNIQPVEIDINNVFLFNNFNECIDFIKEKDIFLEKKIKKRIIFNPEIIYE